VPFFTRDFQHEWDCGESGMPDYPSQTGSTKVARAGILVLVTSRGKRRLRVIKVDERYLPHEVAFTEFLNQLVETDLSVQRVARGKQMGCVETQTTRRGKQGQQRRQLL
jgi:hypothetical protein